MNREEQIAEEIIDDEEIIISAEANAGLDLVVRLAVWVERFEKMNPNPKVRALHPEYFLLKESLEVIEPLVEFMETYDGD